MNLKNSNMEIHWITIVATYANGCDVKRVVNFYLMELCVTGMKGM